MMGFLFPGRQTGDNFSVMHVCHYPVYLVSVSLRSEDVLTCVVCPPDAWSNS